MEREIKFRGKTIDNGEWVYGYFYERDGWYWIINEEGKYEVDHKTVGQYIGLKDRKGNDIYEGQDVRILYTDWISKSDDDPRTLEQYLIDISHIGHIDFDQYEWVVKIKNRYDEFASNPISHGKHGFIEII